MYDRAAARFITQTEGVFAGLHPRLIDVCVAPAVS